MILLLRTLLGVEGRDVRATPSFRPWLNGEVESGLDIGSRGGLLLLDTRDAEARADLEQWTNIRESLGAALVLGRTRRTFLRPRDAWRDLRERRSARIPAPHLQQLLPADGVHLTGLAFSEEERLPTSFQVSDTPGSINGFLLTRNRAFSGRVWDACSDQLGGLELQVNAFHLRARGPAVVDVRAGGQRLILRVVPDPKFHDLVSRNHAALLTIRNAVAADSDLTPLLPRPKFTVNVDGTLVLAEEFMAGALAWRLARGPLASAIRRDTLEFLSSLRKSTLKRVVLDEAGIGRLISADMERTRAAGFLPQSIKRALLDEFGEATRNLVGQEVELHASHGDFGYGNILVDPANGTLAGVIDWDTSRLEDLPGIDRINLEIQTWRTIEAASFDKAARHVWETAAAREAFAISGNHPAGVRGLYGVGVCRYVTRLLNYPDIYVQKHDEISRALKWLRSVPY